MLANRPFATKIPVIVVLATFIVSLTFPPAGDAPDFGPPGDAALDTSPPGAAPSGAAPPGASSPIIEAAGVGNPYANFLDGVALEANPIGERALIRAVESGLAKPTALTVADFDNDGVGDLVTAYELGGENAGLLGIRRGNIDARHPNLPAARVRKADGTFTGDPFFADERLVPLGFRPDFIESGDFDADRNVDLALARRGDEALYVMPGLGDGRFRRGVALGLGGGITALASDDINRRDGLPELLVGTSDVDGGRLSVFESPAGAISATAEHFETPESVSDIVTGSFDRDWPIDVAFAAGREIHIISGRDRQLYLRPERRNGSLRAAVTEIQLAEPVARITGGYFTDDAVEDLAIVLESGRLGLFGGDTRVIETTPYRFPDAVEILDSKVAARPGADLVVLGRNAVHILHRDHLTPRVRNPEAEPVQLAPITFPMDLDATAIHAGRLNGDGLRDLAVAGTTRSGPNEGAAVLAVVNSAPLATFNVNDPGTDDDDTSSDGECRTESGTCTLRAASQQLRSLEGPHLITFSVTNIETASGATIPTFTETVTIDGESFGDRVAILGFLGTLRFNDGAIGSLVKGVSVASVIASDYFTMVNTYVGVNAAGNAGLEGSSGLSIRSHSDIGGPNESERNVIGRFQTFSGRDNLVFNNYIGTNAEGSATIGEIGPGVSLDASSEVNRIGGLLEGQGNVISGLQGDNNRGYGLDVAGQGHTIQGNLVGTDASGFFALGNTSDGIWAKGTTSVLDNVFAANGQSGIKTGNRTGTLVVQGNLVGTDRSGEAALPNMMYGIHVSSDSAVVIGGAEEDDGNVVSGNTVHGIRTGGFSSNDRRHIIQGNKVGTTRSGTPLPNGEHGMELANRAGAQVGGIVPGEANTIAHNTQHGVTFRVNTSRGHTISGNSIFENGWLGIAFDWNEEDPSDNDEGDADDGPNGEQNHPELTVNSDGSISAVLNSMPNQTYTIEFFGSPACDNTGFGQGMHYLQTDSIATDGNGNGVLDIRVSPLEGQQFISATATDPDGNTSEFSNCVETDVAPAFLVIVRSDSLGLGFAPVVANTEFNLFKVDFSEDEPFTLFGSRTTDGDGRLILDPGTFGPGEEFMISLKVDEKFSPKNGRNDVDFLAYQTFVDNLIVERDGSIRADVLSDNTDQPSETYLGHMTVVFNLVVSIEWPAGVDYTVGLVSALQATSNYLYDVTNGQARFGKIAIYDNKRHWEEADIQIHASNLTWPNAVPFGVMELDGRMYMPPIHYGTKETNISEIYADEDFNPAIVSNVKTLGHEFGHLGFGLLDEYQGKPAGSSSTIKVFPFTNFSFMDYQLGSGSRSSEMSALVLLSPADQEKFKQTEQWQENGQRDGWGTFAARFSTAAFPNVPALVHTPERLGLMAFQVVSGPNNDLFQPDLDVGGMMEFEFEISEAEPRLGYRLTSSAGDPVPGALVAVEKSTGGGVRWLKQGKSVLSGENAGRIRPLGLGPDDQLVTVVLSRSNYSFARVDGPAISAAKQQDDIVVELTELSGDMNLLATVVVEPDGGLRYEATSETSLGDSPELTVIRDDQPVETIGLGGGPTSYEALLGVIQEDGAVIVLTGTDANGAEFPVPHDFRQFAIDTSAGRLIMPAMDLEIAIDSTERDIERLAVLSSSFPAPEPGIPDSMVRVSPVYGISATPESGAFEAYLTVYFANDTLLTLSQRGVTIFKWEEDAWSPLPTSVVADTLVQTAIAPIDEGGLYVTYLDLTTATMTDTEPDPLPDGDGVGLMRNYPNPFSGSTTIPLYLDRPAEIGLTVYNVLGQVVRHREPTRHQAGEQRLVFEAAGLSPGTYFYVVTVNGKKRTGVMLVAR